MKHTNKLTQWVINKIETEYKEDIALLLAVKGHCTDDDRHGECFDYFIPATDRGCELSQTFIIDGVGHDLYPRSWERVAQSATLDEMSVVLATAEILYARSQQDIDRFHALQEQLENNLKDPVFTYHKALERLDDAMDIYRTLMFEDKTYRARSEASYILGYLTQAVAYLNGTFAESPIFSERQAYESTLETRLYHCPDLISVPDAFFENAGLLLTTSDIDEIKRITHALICSTKDFIHCKKPALPTKNSTIDYQNLADWYQELSLTWRRIRYFCKKNMVEEAYKDACYLQSELIIIAAEFQIEELNLLDSFDPNALSKLALRSEKLENVIRKIIADHGIKINEYASIEEFLATNARGN
uniref:hypothetical protein n=1 Tax=Acetatifactor sp. TaxID=1872090 RepID=UPI004056A3D7